MFLTKLKQNNNKKKNKNKIIKLILHDQSVCPKCAKTDMVDPLIRFMLTLFSLSRRDLRLLFQRRTCVVELESNIVRCRGLQLQLHQICAQKKNHVLARNCPNPITWNGQNITVKHRRTANAIKITSRIPSRANQSKSR